MATRKPRPATISEKLDVLVENFSAFTRGENGTPGAYERFRNIETRFDAVDQAIVENRNMMIEHSVSTMHSPETMKTLNDVAQYLKDQKALKQAAVEAKKSRRATIGKVAITVVGAFATIVGGWLSVPH